MRLDDEVDAHRDGLAYLVRRAERLWRQALSQSERAASEYRTFGEPQSRRAAQSWAGLIEPRRAVMLEAQRRLDAALAEGGLL